MDTHIKTNFRRVHKTAKSGVMPTELFVSCAVDSAAVGGHVVVVVRSPPAPSSFCLRGLGNWKVSFFLAIPLRSGRAEFLRGGDVSGTLATRTYTGGSVGALPVYSLF